MSKNKALNKGILFISALEIETQGQLEDYDVLYTGVGKVNATYSLTTHFGKYGSHIPYDLVINYGTAGSRKHSIGELVDCTKFIQRDMDVRGLGFMKSQTPFEPLVPIILDSSHVEFNPIGMKETCATGDSFVQEETDYIVDMEAYALAKVCWLRNVDFISFKYITDGANESSDLDWEKNLADGIVKFKDKILDELATER
tara:strand:+ start:386 stop:985 length:600 start_codon:yes stop_codon:yes gene_type:complete